MKIHNVKSKIWMVMSLAILCAMITGQGYAAYESQCRAQCASGNGRQPWNITSSNNSCTGANYKIRTGNGNEYYQCWCNVRAVKQSSGKQYWLNCTYSMDYVEGPKNSPRSCASLSQRECEKSTSCDWSSGVFSSGCKNARS